MPERVRVTVEVDQATADRYTAAAYQLGRDVRLLMAEGLRAAARALPEPEATQPFARRSFKQLRDESRRRHGGVGAHTQTLQQLHPPDRDGS